MQLIRPQSVVRDIIKRPCRVCKVSETSRDKTFTRPVILLPLM